MSKWQKFKDWLKSVRRHKFLYLTIVLLGFALYHVVRNNYSFQQPIVNKRSESYYDVWNERAICLQQLDNLNNIKN